jgi:uncharacterized protein
VVKLYFLDSSALIKRYVREDGSAWIKNITNPAALNPLMVARITWVEVLSGFARLQREGIFTTTVLADTINDFYYDWDIQYQVVELDWSLTQVAGQLVQKHPLRAYDSVQLATALKLQATFARFTNVQFVFVSADRRLLTVAQAVGLLIDNPINYS